MSYAQEKFYYGAPMVIKTILFLIWDFKVTYVALFYSK